MTPATAKYVCNIRLSLVASAFLGLLIISSFKFSRADYFYWFSVLSIRTCKSDL